MIRYSHLGINKITILLLLGINKIIEVKNHSNIISNFHLSFLKFQVLCKIILGFVESLTSSR